MELCFSSDVKNFIAHRTFPALCITRTFHYHVKFEILTAILMITMRRYAAQLCEIMCKTLPHWILRLTT